MMKIKSPPRDIYFLIFLTIDIFSLVMKNLAKSYHHGGSNLHDYCNYG